MGFYDAFGMDPSQFGGSMQSDPGMMQDPSAMGGSMSQDPGIYNQPPDMSSNYIGGQMQGPPLPLGYGTPVQDPMAGLGGSGQQPNDPMGPLGAVFQQMFGMPIQQAMQPPEAPPQTGFFTNLLKGALNGMGGGAGAPNAGQAFMGGFQAATMAAEKAKQEQQAEADRQRAQHMQDISSAMSVTTAISNWHHMDLADEATQMQIQASQMAMMKNAQDMGFKLIPIHNQGEANTALESAKAAGIDPGGSNGQAWGVLHMGDTAFQMIYDPNTDFSGKPYHNSATGQDGVWPPGTSANEAWAQLNQWDSIALSNQKDITIQDMRDKSAEAQQRIQSGGQVRAAQIAADAATGKNQFSQQVKGNVDQINFLQQGLTSYMGALNSRDAMMPGKKEELAATFQKIYGITPDQAPTRINDLMGFNNAMQSQDGIYKSGTTMYTRDNRKFEVDPTTGKKYMVDPMTGVKREIDPTTGAVAPQVQPTPTQQPSVYNNPNVTQSIGGQPLNLYEPSPNQQGADLSNFFGLGTHPDAASFVANQTGTPQDILARALRISPEFAQQVYAELQKQLSPYEEAAPGYTGGQRYNPYDYTAGTSLVGQ